MSMRQYKVAVADLHESKSLAYSISLKYIIYLIDHIQEVFFFRKLVLSWRCFITFFLGG